MKTLKFKCTLLSDIVLNTSAATEGEQTSLDFIPGNNFLGIVATCYNDFSASEQMEVFHSGHVRFADAHPSGKDAKVRSLHIPATFCYPKGKSAAEECYAYQSYSRKEDARANGKPQQLKQCRSGYYVFQDNEGRPITVNKSFALKSAYERALRRSKDNNMYGYEALDQGQVFLFDVEADNDELAGKIARYLVGVHHIGRSRTAQYGLVDIEPAEYADVPSRQEPVDTKDGKRIAVYADSRLIFLDEAGQPSFRPTARQLGLNGEIDWENSQIRTFQYSPWNGKRQSRDADRCGIEKGSVIFVISDDSPNASRYVGNYNNEGFGRVIYNPDFLRSAGNNGKAAYTLRKEADDHNSTPQTLSLAGTPLLKYVAAARHKFETEGDIAEQVNDFVEKNKKLFMGPAFASQWGRIRKIAMNHPTKDAIVTELFDKHEQRWHYSSPSDPTEGYKDENVAYLQHGIASKKWQEKGRNKKLREFIDNIKDADFVQQAVVNLASEMAKICTRNGRN